MDVQSTQAGPRSRTDRLRYRRGVLAIILLALVAVGVIAFLKSQRSPVNPIDYKSIVKQKTNDANRQDDLALTRFRDSLEKEIARYEPWFVYAASEAGSKASKPTAMEVIVYYLAKDQIYGRHETDNYLTKKIGPILDPIVDGFARDVNMVMDRFENDLRLTTVKLAIDLAAIGPGNPRLPRHDVPSVDSWAKFNQALKNLGCNTAGVAVSVAFDVTAIADSQVSAEILKRIVAASSRIFARQAARVVALVPLPALDGPLPIGDILALAGIAWTAYDISQMHDEFRDDVRKSTRAKLDEIRDVMNNRAKAFADSKVAEFKKLQAAMGATFVDANSGRGAI